MLITKRSVKSMKSVWNIFFLNNSIFFDDSLQRDFCNLVFFIYICTQY